ncbi:MAG: TolC family protein [Bacteroidota bacterium]
MKNIIFVCIISLTVSLLNAQEVRIGIIADFDQGQERLDFLRQELLKETEKTLGSSTKVLINDADVIAIGWDPGKASQAYNTLSNRCDIIVMVGVVGAKNVLEKSTLSKPTLAIGIANVDIQEIPITANGTSGIKNFSYILTARDIKSELTKFKELVDFRKIVLLGYEKSLPALNMEKAEASAKEWSELFESEVILFPVGTNVNESLQKLPDDVDAAMVVSIYEFDDDEIQAISDELISRKIPSYSLAKEYVRLGILSSVSADNGFGSLVRKLAIMIDDIRSGTPASDLSVSLDIKNQLYFNVETGVRIDYSPSFQTLFTANLINEEYVEQISPTYSINDFLERAFQENLGIQITNKDVELAEKDVKLAVSEYLPDADINLDQTIVNEGSTNEFIGTSESTLTESASLTQLIYSEDASANIRIEKYLKEAQKYVTQQEINDVILDVYNAYFDVLLAKSNVAIQRENLELNKKNLELAQLQRDIGSANSSDVYRWEAEVATATQQIIEDQTALILAKKQLNVLLNNTLEDRFKVEDVNLTDELFAFFDGNIVAQSINGPDDVWEATKFYNEEAKIFFPPRQELLNNIYATDRQLKGNRRAYYTPSVSLNVSQQEILERGGAASTETSTSNFIDSQWSVGLGLSYPIFDGNRRSINIQRTQVQKDQLAVTLTELDNDIEFNINAAVIDLVTSRTNINYSKISSESSWKNFQLQQDFYRQGRVTVTQLFDAQNAALEAKLAFNNSVYNFLVSFVTLENSIGYYSMLISASERAEFEDRYREFNNRSDN